MKKAAVKDTKPRVVIYARVSTDDPRQAGSCDTQIARCEEYCRFKDYEVVDRIKDEGVSGKSMDRPGWSKVEKLLATDAADIVIATALDRMTRTIEGFLRFVREVLEVHGKEFATLQEDINTSTAAGKMFFHMVLVFAQFQREQTSEKTKAARYTKAAGGYNPGRVPFGAQAGPVKGIPVKDPERWPWLELIFDLAAKGTPDNEIIALLKDKGVLTATGALVGKTTLPRIIESRFYLGEVAAEGEWFPAKHDCRIDAKLWKAAQRKRLAKAGRPNIDYVYLLDGLVFSSHFSVTHPVKLAGKPCPFRTRKVYGRGGKPYHEYVRGDRIDKYGGMQVEAADKLAVKMPSYVNAEKLDEIVVRWLVEAANSGELKRGLDAAMKDTFSQRELIEKERQAGEQRLGKLKQQHERLKGKVVELALADKDSAVAALDDKLAAIEQEIELAEARMDGHAAALRSIEQSQQQSAEALSHVALVERAWREGHREGLRSLIRGLVKKVDVRADEVLISVYAMPQSAVCEIEPEVAPTGVEPVSAP